MTKQEEIRELTDIDRVLIGYARAVDEVAERELMTNSMMRKEWGVLLEKVKRDLSDLGVVIKVDRELPKNPMDELKLVDSAHLIFGKGNFTCTAAYKDIYTTGFIIATDKYAEAGYEAVEPLMGEKLTQKQEMTL